MGINIAQINAGRSIMTMYELKRLMDTDQVQILHIQEPYVGKDISWSDCQIFHGAMGAPLTEGQADQTIWTLTVVRNPGHGAVLNMHLSDRYCTVLDITPRDGGPELVVVNSYFKYSERIEPHIERLERILDYYRGKYIVISADLNAKSPLWYSSVEDERGRKVEDLIITRDLQICNQKSKLSTYENTRGHATNIDITMTTPSRSIHVAGWYIDPRSFLTDHRLVAFSIEYTSVGDAPPGEVLDDEMPKINMRLIDWRHFDACLKVDLGAAVNFDEKSLDEKIDVLTGILQRAERESAPAYRAARVTPRWWNKELDDLRKEKMRRERILQKARKKYGGEHEAVLGPQREYSRSRTRYINSIRHHKKRAWLECVRISSEEDPWGAAYKILMGRLKKSTQMVALKSEGGLITRPADIAEKMMDGLLPDDTADETEDLKLVREQSSRPVEDWDNPIVQMKELKLAVSRQKNGRAPGADGVRTEIVKRAFSRVGPALLCVVREVFSSGTFPKAWKHGILKIFLKSSDKPPDEIKSYRPITLLPVMGKITERIIAERLKSWLEESNYHSAGQHGFLEGRSTVTAMTRLKEIVKQSESRYVLGVFLDISGAFDNAWWPKIVESLRTYGCPGGLLQLLKSYLSERTVSFSWNGARAQKELTKGCPQGSILGPLLWNVMFETLLKADIGEQNELIAYADDLLIVVQGRSRVDLEVRTQGALNKVVAWSSLAKLTFSQSKSQLLLLKGTLNRSRRPKIIMNNTRLRYAESVKYLGIYVDEGLKFDTHVRTTVAKVKKTFGSLLALSRVSGGYSCGSLRGVYMGMIVPLILYGCEIWGAYALGRKTLTRALLGAQRQVLLRVCKAYRTVSAVACSVIAGVIPIDLMIRERVDIADDIYRGQRREVSKVARRTETLAIWQARWEGESRGRETFSYFPAVAERFKRIFEWNHYATQCFSGHGNFKKKLNEFNLVESPWCDECGPDVEDTAWHTLAECQAFEQERQEISSILIGDERVDRLALVAEQNIKKFVRTAHKVLKAKESRGRDQGG